MNWELISEITEAINTSLEGVEKLVYDKQITNIKNKVVEILGEEFEVTYESGNITTFDFRHEKMNDVSFLISDYAKLFRMKSRHNVSVITQNDWDLRVLKIMLNRGQAKYIKETFQGIDGWDLYTISNPYIKYGIDTVEMEPNNIDVFYGETVTGSEIDYSEYMNNKVSVITYVYLDYENN